eukprot:SAG11_NODE_2228_length_3654_cov_1.962640_2_plen_69_part_00
MISISSITVYTVYTVRLGKTTVNKGRCPRFFFVSGLTSMFFDSSINLKLAELYRIIEKHFEYQYHGRT